MHAIGDIALILAIWIGLGLIACWGFGKIVRNGQAAVSEDGHS